MPNYDNNHIRGDLYITFDVQFPRGGLDDSQKEGVYGFFLSVCYASKLLLNLHEVWEILVKKLVATLSIKLRAR